MREHLRGQRAQRARGSLGQCSSSARLACATVLVAPAAKREGTWPAAGALERGPAELWGAATAHPWLGSKGGGGALAMSEQRWRRALPPPSPAASPRTKTSRARPAAAWARPPTWRPRSYPTHRANRTTPRWAGSNSRCLPSERSSSRKSTNPLPAGLNSPFFSFCSGVQAMSDQPVLERGAMPVPHCPAEGGRVELRRAAVCCSHGGVSVCAGGGRQAGACAAAAQCGAGGSGVWGGQGVGGSRFGWAAGWVAGFRV